MPFITNVSVKIHYVVEGAGEPLVLHHGFSDSLACWYDSGWVEALRDRYRLILIDARGHGRSDRPTHPAQYALDHRLGDVLRVLDETGVERARWVGYSMGGWLGLAAAAFEPQRLVSVVAAGAHPFAESLEPLRASVARGMDGWLSAIEAANGGPLDPVWRERILVNDPAALLASAVDRTDVVRRVAKSRIPTLFVVGSGDPRRRPAERAAEMLPLARVVVIPGCDHLQLALSLSRVLPAALELWGDPRREAVA